MKKLVILLLVTFLLVYVGVVGAEELKFRGVEFGSTTKEIKNKEGQPTEEEVGGLLYKDTLVGENVTILFKLQDKKFASGMYAFNMNPSNPNVYIDKMDRLISQLKDKYGEPSETRMSWIPNPMFEDDLGWAVQTGEVKIIYSWEMNDTQVINLFLGESSGVVNLAVLYEDAKYLPRAKENNNNKL
jgi:hypothetical protein